MTARPYMTIMDARDRLPALHPPVALSADDTAAIQAALKRNDAAGATAIGQRACGCAKCLAALKHAKRADEIDDERAAIARMHENYRRGNR